MHAEGRLFWVKDRLWLQEGLCQSLQSSSCPNKKENGKGFNEKSNLFKKGDDGVPQGDHLDPVNFYFLTLRQ